MSTVLASRIYGNHRYDVYDNGGNITWNEARFDAEERGGHLVTITSLEENQLVTALTSSKEVWMGGFQPPGSLEPRGGWSWVTGESFDFAQWDTSQPNNSSSYSDYLLIKNGLWNDTTYNYGTRYYVVEHDDISSTTGSAPTPSSPILVSSRTYNGHLYEVLDNGGNITWQAARFDAEERGGHLATITSLEENQFVTALTSSKEVWMGGFQSPGSPEPRGGWTWVTGESFDFAQWDTSQPNNSSSYSDYLLIKNGLWNDTTYNYGTRYYVVEHDSVPTDSTPIPSTPIIVSSGVYSDRRYEVLDNGGNITWQAARFDAEEKGGHLATITSLEENQFVTGLTSSKEVWMGGFQSPGSPEPRGGWTWVTGEPFDFTQWDSSQPNNSSSYSDYLLIKNGSWNDTTYNYGTRYYVVEYENSTPTVRINHLPTGNVSFTGTPTQGQTLLASNTLADVDGIPGTISYQWRADGTAISDATENSFMLAEAQVGKAVSVVANYTDGQGTAESVTSAQTVPVAASGTVGVTISGTDFVTSEQGDTAIFSVQLNSAPNRDVTISFTSSDTSEGAITNSALTFTATNWAVAQGLTVTGQDDTEQDGNVAYQVRSIVNTIDVHYSDVTIAPFSLMNNDNEIAGVTIYGDVGGSKADVLVGTSGNDKLFGLNMKDDLSGGAGNDELWGGYDNDVLFGEDGADKLYGEQNNDYMDGGAGNDILDGGMGIDTMIGGAGNDTYYLGYDAKDVITDNGLATDIDTVIMPYNLTSYTLPTGIEKGTISPGTQASNLTGNAGNNALTGNAGSNILNGAVGRDSLFAGSGDDLLNGGVGNDVLNGGAGKDTFFFNTTVTKNIDKITDFKPIDDTIQLENAIFTSLTVTGVLNIAAFYVGSSAADSFNRVIYEKSTGAVLYDDDGNGAHPSIQIASIGINLTVTNADFIIV